jgi:hypothetical protein
MHIYAKLGIAVFIALTATAVLKNRLSKPKDESVFPISSETVEGKQITDSIALVEKADTERRKAKAEVLKKKMRKKVDDMKGTTFYYDLSSTQYTNRNAFHAYIGQDKDQVWLRFVIQYYADDWLFIEKYLIKTDSVVTELYPNSTVERDNGDSKIWEFWDGSVDATSYALLKQVAASKAAKIRFEGQRYYQEKPITPAQKQAIKNVLELYEALGGKVPER